MFTLLIWFATLSTSHSFISCRWFAWCQWWKKRATEHPWWPSYTCLRHFPSALPSLLHASLLDGSLLYEVEYFVCCQFFPYTPNLGKAFCLVAMMKKSWYRNFIDDAKLVVLWATIRALCHCSFCPFLCRSVFSSTVANLLIRISHIINMSPALVFGQLAWRWWDIVELNFIEIEKCPEPISQRCAACLSLSYILLGAPIANFQIWFMI